MTPRQPRSTDRSRLAPSIQRAHRRVLLALAASIPHSLLLLGFAVHALFLREDPRWIAGLLWLGGALVVPILARASYRGNSLAALLLLLTVVAPPVVLLLAGRTPAVSLVALIFAPFYYLGARGAIGLRGRRGSKRS